MVQQYDFNLRPFNFGEDLIDGIATGINTRNALYEAAQKREEDEWKKRERGARVTAGRAAAQGDFKSAKKAVGEVGDLDAMDKLTESELQDINHMYGRLYPANDEQSWNTQLQVLEQERGLAPGSLVKNHPFSQKASVIGELVGAVEMYKQQNERGKGPVTKTGWTKDGRKALMQYDPKSPNADEHGWVQVGGAENKPLSPGSMKIVDDNDKIITNGNTALRMIEDAEKLNETALHHPGAVTAAGYGQYLTDENIPNWVPGRESMLEYGKASQDTLKLRNATMRNALTQLKTIFSGATSEKESAMLLEIEGAEGASYEVQLDVLRRARDLIKEKQIDAFRKSESVRSGTFHHADQTPQANWMPGYAKQREETLGQAGGGAPAPQQPSVNMRAQPWPGSARAVAGQTYIVTSGPHKGKTGVWDGDSLEIRE